MKKEVGQGIADAIESRIGKSEKDLFITSKLGIIHIDSKMCIGFEKNRFPICGLNYLDLYLIHTGQSHSNQENRFFAQKRENFFTLQ